MKNGATTVWERWNPYAEDAGFGPVGMNSFNHYAYGAIMEWMYPYMAGIARDPDGPGFKRFDEVAVPADSEATLRAPAVSADGP